MRNNDLTVPNSVCWQIVVWWTLFKTTFTFCLANCLAFCPRFPYGFTESTHFELHFSFTCLHLEEALWEVFLGKEASLLGEELGCGPLLFLGLHCPTKWREVFTEQQTLVLGIFTKEVATFWHFFKCNASSELFFFAWKQSHVLKDSRAVHSRGGSLPHCHLPSHCWHSVCSECWSGYLHYLE